VVLGPSSAHEAGKDFTDARGRRWLAAERIDAREVDAREVDVAQIDVAQIEKERRIPDDRAASATDPRTMSREDLAGALCPRRLVGGYEYRLDEPDYEIADQILAMPQPPSTDGSMGESERVRAAEAPHRSRGFVVGADDRRRLENPRFLPGSAFAYLSQNCTATMIGPSTGALRRPLFLSERLMDPDPECHVRRGHGSPDRTFWKFRLRHDHHAGRVERNRVGLGFRSPGIQPDEA
jgi:hypothetical protein